MPADEFERRWENQRVGGVSTGLNRFMMAMVPDHGSIRLPDGRQLAARDVRFPASQANDPVWWSVGLAGVGMDYRYAFAQNVGFFDRVGLLASGTTKLWGLGVAASLRMMGLGGWSEPFLKGLHGTINGARHIAGAVGGGVAKVVEGAKAVGNAVGNAIGAVGNLLKFW